MSNTLADTTVLGWSMCRNADFDGGDDGTSGAICWLGERAAMSVVPDFGCILFESETNVA